MTKYSRACSQNVVQFPSSKFHRRNVMG